jgi:single-strand DNA-binding protein
MNNVSLIGRLTKDYELKDVNGKSVGAISIAVDDGWGDNKHTSFYDIRVYGEQAKKHGSYISKGSMIGVTGSLRQNRWEKDGVKRSAISISAVKIDYLDSKPKTVVDDEDNIPF